mmetsp:Transcript_38073/g.65290  ORF Transcript_38073/g.65290 Transcript_38073/m.65290 type:complete len:141 (-) Transcript_38073:64-486(-)
MSEDIVNISSHGKIRNYISYIEHRLQVSEEITIKGKNKSIGKAITVAEIIKRKQTLYQITSLSSESGSGPNIIPIIEITLTKTNKYPNHISNQPPNTDISSYFPAVEESQKLKSNLQKTQQRKGRRGSQFNEKNEEQNNE